MTNEELVLKCLSKPFNHNVYDIKKFSKLSIDEIKSILDKLIEENKIHTNSKKDLFYIKLKGTIDIKDMGYGFIKVEDSDKEYHVNENDTKGALSGDLVEFYVLPSVKKDHLDSAVVLNVLEHSNDHVFGKLCVKINKHGKSYYIESHKNDFKIKAEVNEIHLNGAIEGNIVVAKILDYVSPKKVNCAVEKILGYKDDPNIEISLIAAEHGFNIEFSNETMEEIKSIPNSINKDDFKDRVDYTNLPIITIDGNDSKDFDDAVYVERVKQGYKLIVCIADVAYYVKEGSALDKDAYSRGTSVYLANSVIPMLPQKLSNGICSLNPNEYRLCNACEMIIDKEGRTISYELHEGIMKSYHRMTYENVNKMFNGEEDTIKEYEDIYQMLLDMKELSNVIRIERTRKGAIEFDTPEYEVKLDEMGEPVEFKLRTRGEAEMMIEDFMLKANETVAYHLNVSNLPCLYRVHETPDNDKVVNVFKMINNLTNHNVRIPKNDIEPYDIQQVMSLVKDSPSYMAINTLMLRSMKKARYSELSLGHYGLALTYYCHFTSPIRRYPDLVVHRILKKLVFNTNNFKNEFDHFEEFTHYAAIDTSKREKASIECEREVDDMLASKYMSHHINETFEGIVSSVTGFGMFVMLDNGIEGLIHVSNMADHYNFNESLMTLESRSKSFKIGDKVNIICVNVSVKERNIDFMLVDDYNLFASEVNTYGKEYRRK